MHTPGPWRAVQTYDGYFTHQIEIAEGHIASVTGWSRYGEVCDVTRGNVSLIEHAPDMAKAIRDLLAWADLTGGWDAPCWLRARQVLEHASADERASTLVTRAQSYATPTIDIIATAGGGETQ